MIQRCRNPKVEAYHRYGGRGISVCDRWQTFENFAADMGPRPKEMQIDRIDNDGDYRPGNCRWATRKEQGMNRTYRTEVIVNGISATLTQHAKTRGIGPATIRHRVKKLGLSPEVALALPVKRGNRNLNQGTP